MTKSVTLLHRGTATALYGLILAGLVPVVAAAQDAPPPPPASSAPASGQAPADAAPADAKDPGTTVTVQGKKAQNRIDRQVYDTKNDIDANTGTAADALNKVPSVNVDNDGNVSLRGNSNVQVYVDGKPSAMMKGDNRAATLQSMQSGDIDSVEVMNNPGAQFSAEGSGGIINIVMKKNRKPGASGTILVNAGSQGRYNGSFSGSRNSGKLTLSGGANFRHDGRDSRGSSTQQRFENGVAKSERNQAGESQNRFDNLSLTGGADYTITDTDTISTQLGYGKRTFDNSSVDSYTGFDTDGPIDYVRNSKGEGDREDTSATFHWDHTGDQPAETLKFDLRISTSNGGNSSTNVNDYADAGKADFHDLKASRSRTGNGVFSIDYQRNVGEHGQLTAGTQTTIDDNHFINTSVLPDCPTSIVNDSRCLNNASLNSDFAYKQIVNAAYVTYQTAIGDKLIVQGGLRSETIDLTTRQLSTNTTGNTNYTKLVPSAFATYTLSDRAKLRFSYSHRLRRPNPQDLNPFFVYVDPYNVSAGNPDLKPSESDSFEAGYEYQKDQTAWQLRAYYRKNRNSITSFSYFLPSSDPALPRVLVTTQSNLGEGQSGGMEFNYNGKFGSKLSVNLNGNLGYEELSTPNGGDESGTTLRGRVSLDYTITPKDRMQLSVFTSGRQLSGQGYRSPFSMGNLSYRHNFNPKVAMTVTVSDPFRTGKFENVTDTDFVYSVSHRSLSSPTFYVGLSYILGGAPQNGQQPGQQNQPGQGQWQGGGRGNWGGPGGGGGMGPGGGF